jgi:hypothetical protein
VPKAEPTVKSLKAQSSYQENSRGPEHRAVKEIEGSRCFPRSP